MSPTCSAERELSTGSLDDMSDLPSSDGSARDCSVFWKLNAALFKHLGLNVSQTTLIDNNGRPQYLVAEGGTALPELI